MPTYQYACTECDHAFEQFQSFSDDALTECPACSGRLRKLFNAVGVVFKGSGFYRTDSRAGSGSSGSSAEGSGSATAAADSGSGAAKPGSSDSSADGSSKAKETAGAGGS